MLGKLLKYEYKATARLFLPMYAILILMALISRLLNLVTANMRDIFQVPGIVMTVLYCILIVAALVGTFVFILIRFYKNLMGDEGYLMFTLPVNVDQNILSKLIVGVTWMIGTFVAIMVSVLVVTAGPDTIPFLQELFLRSFPAATEAFGLGFWWVFAEFWLMVLIAMVANILMFYAAMAIGPNLVKSRALGSILAFFILYVAGQILSTLGLIMIGALGGVPWIEGFVMGLSARPLSALAWTMAGAGMLALVEGIVCYFLTRYFLKNKLNLA